MSKETVLKKEFQKKDVERLRNLMQGKYGEKTRSSVGFTNPQEFYDEGDVWESDGRTWTIEKGIKQNITKLDKAKKAHIMPIFCPNCGSKMHTDLDKPYYNIHKKCFNCVVEFEHHLKVAGLYEAYESKIINSEIDNFVNEFKAYIEAELVLSNKGFITEQGDVESWVGAPNKSKVLEGLNKTIEHLNNLKR